MKDLIKALIAEVIPATVRTLDAATAALNEYTAQAQKAKPKGRQVKEKTKPVTEPKTEVKPPKDEPEAVKEVSLEQLRELMILFSSTKEGNHDPDKRGQIVGHLEKMKLKKIDELSPEQRVGMYVEFLGRMGGM